MTDGRESYQEKLAIQMGLLDLTQDALIIRDLEDRIEAWNRGAERLYGWSAAEALGKNIQDLRMTALNLDPSSNAACATTENAAVNYGK